MKKLVIAFTLFACVFTKSSAASDGIVTPEVLKSFQSKFSTATNADWSLAEDLYKVQFALNGQTVIAYYKEDGTMTALTRNITSAQLPISLQTGLKNDYKAYWVADLFELSTEEGVQYYVTLEDADSKLILKSSAANWTTFQKKRKD